MTIKNLTLNTFKKKTKKNVQNHILKFLNKLLKYKLKVIMCLKKKFLIILKIHSHNKKLEKLVI